MRLWHQSMIPNLSREHLLGQHREVAALRGNGWGKKHKTVNYVFKYSYSRLYQYHCLIMDEMINRKYKPDAVWFNPFYREKDIGYDYSEFTRTIEDCAGIIYPEHDNNYFNECLENLKSKGFDINQFV